MTVVLLPRNSFAFDKTVPELITSPLIVGERPEQSVTRPAPKRRPDHQGPAENAIYRELADRLGVPFFAFPLRLDPTISAPDAMTARLAPVDPRMHAKRSDLPNFIYAPEGDALKELAAYQGPTFNRNGLQIGITTPRVFRSSIRATFGSLIAQTATLYLPRSAKAASALSRPLSIWIVVLGGFVATILAGLIWTNTLWHMVLLTITCFPVLPGLVIKLMALHSSRFGDKSAVPLADHDLPTYTVLVPVYKERRILKQLIQSLCALDYPHEKLDIKLLIETDDVETLSALDDVILPPRFDVLICPRGRPRTKPRALQIGLAYTHSELVVVYDAEDIPEPDQLKKAAAIFAQSDDRLACLQARLTIDNLDDSWLTRQFALEYAALFDVLLPGLAYLNQPIPLGGTSNHFRCKALRDVGAWDPWNVTEDADLGLRLFRAGYQIKTFHSTTYEEAPVQLGAWSKQRTRWLKGWMQTAAVHLRPHGSHRDRINATQWIMLILAASLSPLTILFHPLLLFGLDVLIDDVASLHNANPMNFFLGGCFIVMFLASFLFDMMLIARGARERAIDLKIGALIGMLPYSCLKTWAAWRGLLELLHAPFLWHKTDHGLARTSRLLRYRPIKTAS